MSIIFTQPLTRASFAAFGEVIDLEGATHYPINDGNCERYHALAGVEIKGDGGRIALSIFKAKPYKLPLQLTMMERHPLGSQAFMPLSTNPFLVVVAPDENGRPGLPHAFITGPGQGVNYPPNLWHGVVTPLDEAQDFLVVDRVGEGQNLETFFFSTPYEIRRSAATS